MSVYYHTIERWESDRLYTDVVDMDLVCDDCTVVVTHTMELPPRWKEMRHGNKSFLHFCPACAKKFLTLPVRK